MIFCRIPFLCDTKHSVKWNWPINNQPRIVSAFKYSGRDVIDLKMRWSVRLQCLMMYEVWHSSMLFLYTTECFRFVFAGWNPWGTDMHLSSIRGLVSDGIFCFIVQWTIIEIVPFALSSRAPMILLHASESQKLKSTFHDTTSPFSFELTGSHKDYSFALYFA